MESLKFSCSVIFALGVFSIMFIRVQGDDYLKEAPSFLQPCSLSDPNNGVCLAKSLENVFTNWRDGIPGLKGLGSIDPFKVKKLHLEQDNPSISINMDLKDAVIEGMSHSTITKASITNDYTFKILLKIPSLVTKGVYRIKGNILVLNLDSSGGNLEMEGSDMEVFFAFKTKLITNHNQKFFDVTSVRCDIKKLGNFHIHFTNLFNGNAELEKSANDLFNQNWKDLFEILRPAVQEILESLALDRYKKIYNFVPAKYVFNDVA